MKTKHESPTTYYHRKIAECLHELQSATELGKKRFVRYYRKEVDNYEELLVNYKQELSHYLNREEK